jgi:RNA polymerase sigma factor (sigma-70 family)
MPTPTALCRTGQADVTSQGNDEKTNHRPQDRGETGALKMTCAESSSPPETDSDESTEDSGRDDLPLVQALADGTSLQNQLYVRYRRPLLQVLLQRRIAREAAKDILQRTFLIAIRKIRADGLADPSKLGGYLYRTAINLAKAYWRGELAREYDSDLERLSNIQDEALSLEERVDHEQLAKCVRDLMDRLPVERDREVLERFYLDEEPRTAIQTSLKLTELQFNQVLWRARQRFGDILRKHRAFASEKTSVD